MLPDITDRAPFEASAFSLSHIISEMGIGVGVAISLSFPCQKYARVTQESGFSTRGVGHLAILWNSAFKRVYLSFSPLPFASLLSHLFVRGNCMDCSFPGFSVHGIFLERILEWIAIS